MPGSQFYDWPDWATEPTPQQLQKVYEDGFPGAPEDPGNVDQLFSDGLVSTFSAVAGHLRDLHKQDDRKVVPLFLSREKVDPGAFGQEAQTTGDCVSHGSRNARDITRCIEFLIHGEAEVYEARGATEPTYGYRGHRGAGMDPARAARFETQTGWLLRKNYPGVVDLTTYNSRIGTGWGGRGVPRDVEALCNEHKVGKWIAPESLEEALDLFAAGYACHSGQNVGFSNSPNSKGIHPMRGRWNHDMASTGYDISKEVWPVDVVFVQNSWGDFNVQPESKFTERGWPRIPGCIVADAGDWWDRFGTCYFYADVEGIPAKDIVNWGDIGL